MRAFFPVFVALLLVSCATSSPSPPSATSSPATVPATSSFRAHTARVLEETFAEIPELAIRAGNYKHAARLTIPDAAQRERRSAFYRRELAELARFSPASLNAMERVELAVLKNRFERGLWEIETFRDWQWQPSKYNVANELDLILTTDYAPREERLRTVLARLEGVPAYFAAAKANIANPTLEHTQLAIVQNKGALRGLAEDFSRHVDGSALSAAEKALFTQRLQSARAAIEDYVAWLGALEARLAAAGNARSFRIGKALYEQKFAFEIQSSFTAEELYHRALTDKFALHDAMEMIARELWPKYLRNAPMPEDRLVLIRRVIDEVAKRHVARQDFVPAVRRQIAELAAFVRDKDLVDQDPSRPLVVRETPMYMRGVAGASVSAAGPLNPTANTYYNVTPLDAFTAEQAESYLREYNNWTLQILNIHEAIPGHYTQLMHANKSPSLVKAAFANGSMIEGWAVFGEKVMLDAGYGGPSAEMWLSWMKWNLRSVTNTILDYEIHNTGLQADGALRLMVREAFQEDAEAREKWRRAKLTQVQLASYYNGYVEITALRDEIRARQASAFSVKKFNNAFLSYGNAPVRHIRTLMLEPQ